MGERSDETAEAGEARAVGRASVIEASGHAKGRHGSCGVEAQQDKWVPPERGHAATPPRKRPDAPTLRATLALREHRRSSVRVRLHGRSRAWSFACQSAPNSARSRRYLPRSAGPLSHHAARLRRLGRRRPRACREPSAGQSSPTRAREGTCTRALSHASSVGTLLTRRSRGTLRSQAADSSTGDDLLSPDQPPIVFFWQAPNDTVRQIPQCSEFTIFTTANPSVSTQPVLPLYWTVAPENYPPRSMSLGDAQIGDRFNWTANLPVVRLASRGQLSIPCLYAC